MKLLGKRLNITNKRHRFAGFVDDYRKVTLMNDLSVVSYDECYDGLKYQKRRFYMDEIGKG